MEAVCRVDVVADVLTKNSFGFLTTLSSDLMRRKHYIFSLRNWMKTYAATAMSTERRTADFMLKAERLTEMLEENDRSP